MAHSNALSNGHPGGRQKRPAAAKRDAHKRNGVCKEVKLIIPKVICLSMPLSFVKKLVWINNTVTQRHALLRFWQFRSNVSKSRLFSEVSLAFGTVWLAQTERRWSAA
ncbi:UNVERIFIED_CONTAM: hypothetical protein K2H54_047009 [Gekko kuhli]